MNCKKCGKEINTGNVCPYCYHVNIESTSILEKFENEKKQQKKSENDAIKKNIFLMILFIILIIGGIFFIFNGGFKKEEKEIFLKDFSGVYIGENTRITIYMHDNEHAYSFIQYNDNMSGIYLEFNSDKNLIYKSDDEKVKVEKTSSGIEITSSSEEKNSVLNKINGNYVRVDYNNRYWSDTYESNGTIITIDQYSSENLYITIIKDDDTFIEHSSNFTSKKIEINNIEDIKESIIIEKFDNGIKVSASSEDSLSILNTISGEYKIK